MTNHEATTNTKRDATLRRVQGLIDKAGSTTFQEERDSLLAKADALMAAYAIEQFEVDARRPSSERAKPIVVDVAVSTASDRQVRAHLDTIFRTLARHCDVMIGKGHDFAGAERTWKVVGYPTDVSYLQMLYMGVQLHIVSTIEPKVDPNKSEAENYAVLRDAGIELQRIFALLGIDYYLPGYKETSSGYRRKTNDTAIARLRRQYRKLCQERGEEHVTGELGEAYRLNFLWAYGRRLDERLRKMRGERDAAAAGHELAIIGRKEESQNVLWDTWPELRPHPAECECDGCHVAKCRDSSCERPRCVAARKPVPKSHYREIRFDPRGAAAGRRSADSTNLSRGGVEGGKGGGALGG